MSYHVIEDLPRKIARMANDPKTVFAWKCRFSNNRKSPLDCLQYKNGLCDTDNEPCCCEPEDNQFKPLTREKWKAVLKTVNPC